MFKAGDYVRVKTDASIHFGLLAVVCSTSYSDYIIWVQPVVPKYQSPIFYTFTASQLEKLTDLEIIELKLRGEL